jgi:hypothetical protein
MREAKVQERCRAGVQPTLTQSECGSNLTCGRFEWLWQGIELAKGFAVEQGNDVEVPSGAVDQLEEQEAAPAYREQLIRRASIFKYSPERL